MRFSRRFDVPRLLGGTALVAFLLAGGAQADEPSDQEVDMSAELLTYDGGEGISTASGHVVVRHQGYVLYADKVIYDERTGEVTAEGAVTISDPDGNVLTADHIELKDTLKQGVVENVRLFMDDDSRVAALSGERGETRTRFDRAVYSPCQICAENDRPLWQIKAIRVIHDQDKKRLYYKDAWLEFLGAPILYLPYMSHPAPGVSKASGLLAPQPRQSPELGLVLEVPYFWNIAPDKDLTLTPIITSKEGPVLGAEYRQMLNFGQYDVGGSITYVDQRNALNAKTGDQEFRGHLFSQGIFNHDANSRSRYSLRYASDDTYLRRYDVSNEDTLRSQYVFENFDGRNYLSIQGMAFQGLRIEDIAGLTPVTLPAVDYFYETAPLWLGARFSSRVNALALTRTSGMDTQRLSANGAVTLPYIFASGLVTEMTASVRGDAYHIDDAARSDNPVFAGEDGTVGRFLPRASLELRYPLINNLGDWTQTLEPIVQFVAAPKGGNPIEIPNEDSRVFDLADSNLFSLDRYSGLDRWEGGMRSTYGGRWALLGRDFNLDVLVGQSFRVEKDAASFPDGTGLSGNFSDFVGRISLALPHAVELTHSFRLDKDNLLVRRNEVDLRLGGDDHWFGVGYVKLNRDLDIEDLVNREEIRLSGGTTLTGNWRITAGTIQDLSRGRNSISNTAGLIYSDECFEFRLNYRKNFTEDRDFEPGTTITVRFSLKSLGS